MTYKELIYIILDELKLYSDDASFNEDHIKFLCSKYRALLLKNTYKDIKKGIPDSNYQTLHLDLEVVPEIYSSNSIILKSKDKVPILIPIGNVRISPYKYVHEHKIEYISQERFRFIGHNKWMKAIIYCCKAEDDYLYFKSWNPQHLDLEKITFSGIFETLENESSTQENMDSEFPIEEALVPQLIQLVVQELSNKTIVPEDQMNNASDDKSSLYNYMARNVKSDLAKQLS